MLRKIGGLSSWIIMLLLIVQIRFTRNIVSLLRQFKESNEKIIEKQTSKKPPSFSGRFVYLILFQLFLIV
ncbi:conserved hypothetical protein [Bacillus altitudinis]|nr:conserved hypothetical protein [Bacillus altitudinis]